MTGQFVRAGRLFLVKIDPFRRDTLHIPSCWNCTFPHCFLQVVKVRLQAKEYLAKYRNTPHAFATILREEGLRGMLAIPFCSADALSCFVRLSISMFLPGLF